MSEINLTKEDKAIANTLQKIMGGDDDDFYENTVSGENAFEGVNGGDELKRKVLATSSVGKTLADGNDLRRLLSDLLDIE